MDTVIISNNHIERDIFPCRIVTRVVKTERDSAFSLQEKETKVGYDSCTGQIVSQYYVVPEITDGGSILMVTLWFFGVVIFAGIISGFMTGFPYHEKR